MNKWRMITMALGCLSLIGVATAQIPGGLKEQRGADGEEPATQVLSDTLTYNDDNKTTRFTGHVIMTRGPLTLVSDQLDLREDLAGDQYGRATMHNDKRVQIRQENPEKFEVLVGLGEIAEYDGKAETFELIDRAILVRFICGRPFDTVSAQRIRYDQKTETYRAFGAPQSTNVKERVRSVAQPRAKIDAAVEACRQQVAAGVEPPVVPAMQ